MVTLVFIATNIVKPLLFTICLLSCTTAMLIIFKPSKGDTMKKYITIDNRMARSLIRTFGKEKAREVLKNHGLTFADVGIK